MNKKLLWAVIVGIILIILSVTFIGKNEEKLTTASDGKLKIVTSFYPLYFFASSIGGDQADVTNITPAGAEPHDYEPTPRDMALIQNADILVLNGGNLEAWGGRVKDTINPTHTHIVIAGENLTTQEVVEDGEKIIDPHVWLSPVLATQMVEKITQAFIAADPTHATVYESNAQILKAKLTTLNGEYAQGLSSCLQKNIITSHAAFGYLASNYHLNQMPITGLSPDAEPSPAQLGAIATFAKDNKVKYIFFESLVSPKLSETIAREIGAQTLVLNPIEGLSKDELAAGKDYLTEMESNLVNLQIALQCKK